MTIVEEIDGVRNVVEAATMATSALPREMGNALGELLDLVATRLRSVSEQVATSPKEDAA